MERPQSRDDVAVFIDFENVYVSVREKFDATPNFELIMDRCEDYGRIVIARAYADWYRYPRVTSALFANGVEPMYVPTYYYDREVGRTGRPIKNSVDIHLCIDAMRTLYSQAHIDKFVLVTGDRDFIPLVNAIRQHGKEVIIIGIGGAASAHLAQSGDEFLFYEQIADLKSPQSQRQEQPARQERREKPEPKAERGDRDRSERDRGDGNGKVERTRERDKEKVERTPAPALEVEPAAPEAEPAAPERSVFDTLVDAIQLARQRGFVSNLGSLKVLMRELDSGFNESKVKDSNGRPFSKFKDFVKEAERQGKVQIFTNGTVTEVFLPGENPLVVSQFAEDLASQQVERELENELDAEEALQADTDASPDEAAPMAQQPALPGLPEEATPIAQETVIEAAPVEAVEPAGEDAQTEPTRQTFGDRELLIFRGSMSQFTDPVRFAEIFSALRGLRNQEVLDLTNNELKDLVKYAINKGMLQRTGRGARAYYRLNSQYRVAQDDARPNTATAAALLAPGNAASDQTSETALGIEVESAAGLVNDSGMAPAARRRRGRAYDALMNGTEGSAESAASTLGAGNSPELTDVVTAEVNTQTAEEPTPAKPRRNRRKKPAATASAAPEAATPGPEPVAVETAAADEADEKEPKANNGAKKRRSRRKKPATTEEPQSSAESGE